MLVQRQDIENEAEESEQESPMPMLIQRQEEGEEKNELSPMPTMLQRQKKRGGG